ncbi:MAG: hypothetical protein ACYDDO_04350 [Acidiferrobacterales bacterium]
MSTKLANKPGRCELPDLQPGRVTADYLAQYRDFRGDFLLTVGHRALAKAAGLVGVASVIAAQDEQAAL